VRALTVARALGATGPRRGVVRTTSLWKAASCSTLTTTPCARTTRPRSSSASKTTRSGDPARARARDRGS